MDLYFDWSEKIRCIVHGSISYPPIGSKAVKRVLDTWRDHSNVGVLERPLGFYDPVYIAKGISTNIFTAYRGLITDFSISGSILIAFVIGFISQAFYQKQVNIPLLNTVPISMFYSFTLYSPLISIFHYNSILFSWLIIIIPLSLSNNESLDNYS